MKIWDDLTSNKQSSSVNKKTLFNLATLLILILGIPLGVFIARQTQIFRSEAAGDPISWVVEGCIVERNGVKIARCPQVKFAIDSPFGGPEGGGPSCPSPTPICTPSAGSPKAIVDLVLDDSSSMECKNGQSDDQCKVKQLQIAVQNIKSLIRPTDVVGIQGLKKVLLPIDTIVENNSEYDEVVDEFKTPNGTPLKDALLVAEMEVKRAIDKFPQNPKKVVILVTDGCPNEGQDPRSQGQKLKSLGWTVAVLAIQLGSDADKCQPYGGTSGARQMMIETASEDLFFEVEDPSDIPESLRNIFTQSVCSSSLDKSPTVAAANFTPANFAKKLIKDTYAQNATPVSGLIGHWKLDENAGTRVRDSSVNGINGDLKGGPSWTSGKYGSAIKFDGNDDYLVMGNNSKFNMGTNNFTFSLWFKTTSTKTNIAIGGEGGLGSGGKRYHFEVNDVNNCGSLGTIKFEIDDNDSKTTACSVKKNFNDDNWHHATGVREGNSIKLYVDGSLEKTTDVSGSGSISSDREFVIGAGVNHSDKKIQQHFPGSLDDVRLYNRALTQSEINTVMNNGSTPTPTSQPAPTSSSNSSPVPTSTPGEEDLTCIGTESYKYAETEAGLVSATEKPYTQGIVIDHTFSNPNPGTKTIFVWFKPKVGTPAIRQLSIDLIAEPIIDTIDCQVSQTGSGITLTLDGRNFGATAGSVMGNESPTSVANWTATQVIVTSNSLTCEEVIHAVLTTKDGDDADITYSPTSQIALGAKLFCRAPQRNDQTDVIISILGEGDTTAATESVSIDKDGLVKGMQTKLITGKKYQIGVKAPKSVNTLSLPFISKGTAQVVLRSRDRDLADRRYINVLPIGDIITLGRGDGVINAIDKSELNKEWGFNKGTVIDQPGDFNQDGKVNSIDWACMRFDFGSKNAIGPTPATLNVPINSEDACTPDKFVCPDGSSVGRVAPSCEFVACPNVTAAPATPAPTSTATPTPFTWNLSGQFSCEGLDPKSTITWTAVPNAAKYDVYKNNALALADQTNLSVALLGDAVGTTSNFVVKAKNSSNEVILSSANIPITAESCSTASPTAAATSTPNPSPTP